MGDSLWRKLLRSLMLHPMRSIELRRTFKTLTVRLSRLTVNAFLENVDLVIRTLGEFGEDAENVRSA